MHAGVFRGRRPSCRVELYRTRLNFCLPLRSGHSFFFFFWHFGISVQEFFALLVRIFHRSSAVALGCEGNGTDPAHIPQQMLRALRLAESLREQLKTKSDIQPLSLCGEVVASVKSWDALQPNPSRLLIKDGAGTDSLSRAPNNPQILNEENAHR